MCDFCRPSQDLWIEKINKARYKNTVSDSEGAKTVYGNIIQRAIGEEIGMVVMVVPQPKYNPQLKVNLNHYH